MRNSESDALVIFGITGDLAYQDSDGYFYIAGRRDDCFKSRGIFVSPTEIENALQKHSAVVEAAVVAEPDAEIGNKIRAVIVLAQGSPPSDALAQSIRDSLRSQIAPYKIPHKIEFTERLPKGEMLAAALSGVLNFSVSHLLRLKITDYTSGFIVCRKDLLRDHPLQGDYGEYFIELMYYLTRRGVDLREVYYESPPRQWGESKTGASHLLLIRRGVKYLWLVSRLILNRSLASPKATS